MEEAGATVPPAAEERRPGRVRRALARTITRLADSAVRLLGASPADGREGITEAELRDLVAANTILASEERTLIDDVLAAGQRQLRGVMVPRTEVVFLDSGQTVSRALRVVRDEPHSRFPVIDGSHDDVVGFVHVRDLLLRPGGDRTLTISALARDIMRFPMSKTVLLALSEMRREGQQLAVVIDEYGGTAGIVTLEDLIEELVGEIRDEYDAPEPGGDPAAPPSEVDGLMSRADFAERTGITLPDGPYETVGGYLMAALGRLPDVGDAVTVEGWDLQVRTLDGRRAARIALRPLS